MVRTLARNLGFAVALLATVSAAQPAPSAGAGGGVVETTNPNPGPTADQLQAAAAYQLGAMHFWLLMQQQAYLQQALQPSPAAPPNPTAPNTNGDAGTPLIQNARPDAAASESPTLPNTAGEADGGIGAAEGGSSVEPRRNGESSRNESPEADDLTPNLLQARPSREGRLQRAPSAESAEPDSHAGAEPIDTATLTAAYPIGAWLATADAGRDAASIEAPAQASVEEEPPSADEASRPESTGFLTSTRSTRTSDERSRPRDIPWGVPILAALGSIVAITFIARAEARSRERTK